MRSMAHRVCPLERLCACAHRSTMVGLPGAQGTGGVGFVRQRHGSSGREGIDASVSRFKRDPPTTTTMPSIRLVASERPRTAVAPMLEPRFERDDYSLVAGIRRGDASAATALFEQYRGLVERTLVRILGFDSELADAVQETFIRALGSTRLLRDPQALPSWLIRIASAIGPATPRS